MKISVIIPAHNEEAVISETIQTVKKNSGDEIFEILVIDGGSSDKTIVKAKAAGASVYISPQKGRAAQMNYGAKRSSGDILYFLHADSKPPVDFGKKIKAAIAGGSQAGCFQLAFDEDHPLLTFYAWFTRFDVDAFRFGDQSLYITRNTFGAINGFREDHIVMEDNEMVRRIKKDYPFSILDDYVKTSARTYVEVGIIKLQLVFVLIYTLYFLGIEQQTLNYIRKNVIQ